MASKIETHVIEIPLDPPSSSSSSQQQQQQQHSGDLIISQHPLTEISLSPGHLLLLKLFHLQESQLSHRIGLKESRLHSLKREAFSLSALFFAFHGLFFTLLFTSSVAQQPNRAASACTKWWVPCFLSLCTSLVLVSAVQAKVWGYWRVTKGLRSDRSDGRALTRITQELRMKGSSFDLSKEPQMTKRMKSSSVEVEWRVLRWWKENLVVLCLLVFAGLVAPASKFILCMH